MSICFCNFILIFFDISNKGHLFPQPEKRDASYYVRIERTISLRWHSMAPITAPQKPAFSSAGYAADGGSARRADGILHRTRVGPALQIKLAGAAQHLCCNAVGGCAGQPVLDACIRQRLQIHRCKCRCTASQRTCRRKVSAVPPAQSAQSVRTARRRSATAAHPANGSARRS